MSLVSNISDRFGRMAYGRLRVIFAITSLIPLIAILVQVVNSVQHPYFNSDDCLWVTRRVDGDFALLVSQVPSGGRASKAGILPGDRVVAINNVVLPNDSDVSTKAQDILNNSPIERAIPYTVERGGQVLTFQIELTRIYSWVNWTIYLFLTLWLLIGIVVVMTQPRGLVQRRFYFAAATVVFAFTFPLGQVVTTGQQIIATIWGVLQLSFFVFWVRFCMSFPVDQKVLSTRFRKILFYAPPLIYLIASFGLDRFIPANSPIVGYFFRFSSLALSTGYFGAGIHLLFRGYGRMPASANRRPIAAIIIGTFLAGLMLLYLGVLSNARQDLFILHPELLLPVVLVLALPLSFGYAIFKYQVMDIRPVVRVTVVYGATMIFIAALYLGLSYGIGRGLGSITSAEMKGTVTVLSFVLVLLLLDPFKRQLQTWIENRFFPQRRDYSTQISAFSTEITEAVGARAVAQLTAATLKSTLDLRGVCVLIDNPISGEFELVARASELDPLLITDEAITQLRQLLRQSHSLIALDTIVDPGLSCLQTRFSYAIGLYAQGRVIGVVLMSRPRNDDGLSGSQTPFIAGITSQAAAALEVARLYEEELARQRYREELATARRIQESLLPARMPDFPGISISAISHPAQAVGGDYYDVIRLDEERLLIIVADVSGKGLPASLYMAELHGMVRVASAIYTTPKEILTILNDHLVAVMERGSFITASMLLFDSARKTVSFARAGHTPIIRRHGSEIDSLVPSGLALGLGPRDIFQPALQQYTVQYEQGETFILYSDGVSEAMNERREEFGDGRLLDVISSTQANSSDEVLNGIFVNVEGFRAGAEQNDDLTIVVIRIEREVEHEPLVETPVEVAAA
jgi:serine phosphatase RsbU (regulator of sigma subunit)